MKKHMFKSGSLLLFSILLFAFIFPSSTILAHAESGNEEMVDIIVRYENTVPNEDELDSSYKNIQTLDILPIQTMTVPKSAVKKISSQKNVKRVTYDQVMTTSDSSRTTSESDWNKSQINAFDAWDEGYTGEDISVAVIDTGFYQHSDINYAGGYSIFGTNDPWTSDTEGHGTHVAGIIAASQESPVRGVAPDVSIYGVKVYPSKEGNSTSTFNLAKGIQWAINNNIDIINISSGYEVANQDIHEVIQEAVNSGILVIAASGNRNDSNNDIDYPAAHPEVIAVSNVDSSSRVADDSMVSDLNELAAPGVGILGLDNVPGEYVSYSGTSQATPHVAGIAAILMQKYKGVLSSSEIRLQLQKEAFDLGTKGFDSLYGHGLVQYVPEVVNDTTDEDTDTSEEVTSPEENFDDNDGETDTETPVSVPGEEEQEAPAEEDTTIEEPIKVNPEPEEEPAANENQPVDVLENAVWIRPETSEGSAIISSEDLNAVADNGTLAISLDYTMDDLDQLNLTGEQVSEIKQRNISILIAKPDIEWLIPAVNFQQGTATVRFTKTLGAEPTQQELAKSGLYQFEFFTNGEPVQSFEGNMTYRFFTDLSEVNQDKLYIWNAEQNEWQELGDTYSNGAIVGTTNQTGIIGVLNPAAFDGATEKEETEESKEKEDETNTEEDTETETEPETESEESEKSEENVEEEEVSATESNSGSAENGEDQEQETESAQNDVSESSAISTPMVAGATVILLSFGGGFYYFGGKSKL